MENYSETKVWRVNGKLVVADTIKEAIDVYASYYKSSKTGLDPLITRIEAVFDNMDDFKAIIKAKKDDAA